MYQFIFPVFKSFSAVKAANPELLTGKAGKGLFSGILAIFRGLPPGGEASAAATPPVPAAIALSGSELVSAGICGQKEKAAEVVTGYQLSGEEGGEAEFQLPLPLSLPQTGESGFSFAPELLKPPIEWSISSALAGAAGSEETYGEGECKCEGVGEQALPAELLFILPQFRFNLGEEADLLPLEETGGKEQLPQAGQAAETIPSRLKPGVFQESNFYLEYSEPEIGEQAVTESKAGSVLVAEGKGEGEGLTLQPEVKVLPDFTREVDFIAPGFKAAGSPEKPELQGKLSRLKAKSGAPAEEKPAKPGKVLGAENSFLRVELPSIPGVNLAQSKESTPVQLKAFSFTEQGEGVEFIPASSGQIISEQAGRQAAFKTGAEMAFQQLPAYPGVRAVIARQLKVSGEPPLPVEALPVSGQPESAFKLKPELEVKSGLAMENQPVPGSGSAVLTKKEVPVSSPLVVTGGRVSYQLVGAESQPGLGQPAAGEEKAAPQLKQADFKVLEPALASQPFSSGTPKQVSFPPAEGAGQVLAETVREQEPVLVNRFAPELKESKVSPQPPATPAKPVAKTPLLLKNEGMGEGGGGSFSPAPGKFLDQQVSGGPEPMIGESSSAQEQVKFPALINPVLPESEVIGSKLPQLRGEGKGQVEVKASPPEPESLSNESGSPLKSSRFFAAEQISGQPEFSSPPVSRSIPPAAAFPDKAFKAEFSRVLGESSADLAVSSPQVKVPVQALNLEVKEQGSESQAEAVLPGFIKVPEKVKVAAQPKTFSPPVKIRHGGVAEQAEAHIFSPPEKQAGRAVFSLAGVSSGEVFKAVDNAGGLPAVAAGEVEVSEGGKLITQGIAVVQAPAGPEQSAEEHTLVLSRALLIEKVKALQEIGQRLAVRSVSLRKNQGIELQLYPPELGRVRIEVSLAKESVKVFFTVENPKIQSSLESNLPELRQNLSAQGLSVGDLGVGVFNSNDPGSRMPSFSGQSSLNSILDKPAEEEKDSPQVQIIRGLVDYLV